MIKSLFISKEKEDLNELVQFCATNQIELIAESLISFEEVSFQLESSYDVIFFSSIRAAIYFLRNAKIPTRKAVACIGNQTAVKLKKLNIHADFVGETSGVPSEVAAHFLNWLGKRTVLIPLSERSNHSIASKIPSVQCVEKIVYRTKLSPKKIKKVDMYVFTSPSNVESFLKANNKPEGKAIAWGETTKKFLLSKDILPIASLKKSSTNELIELLLNL